MYVIGNFLGALVTLLDMGLVIYMYLIIGRALVSWVSADPYNPIVQFLIRATEPTLRPVRRWLPPMTIDFSPVIVIFAIIFVRQAIVRSLFQFAAGLSG